jgi:hypothetical protein
VQGVQTEAPENIGFQGASPTVLCGGMLMPLIHEEGRMENMLTHNRKEWRDMTMKCISGIVTGSLLIAFSVLPAFSAENLDELYGILSQPAYIKHYEADKKGKIMLDPFLQVATPQHPGVLEPKRAPYNWTIDTEGRVALNEENNHPHGRTYKKEWIRPEDKTKRKPGSSEKFGHVTAVGGNPARISGEILYDKEGMVWIINNKSGRYSKRNADRTPEQMANAAKLLREVLDPGSTAWGQVQYLLEYGPESVTKQLMTSDAELRFNDDGRPYLPIK